MHADLRKYHLHTGNPSLVLLSISQVRTLRTNIICACPTHLVSQKAILLDCCIARPVFPAYTAQTTQPSKDVPSASLMANLHLAVLLIFVTPPTPVQVSSGNPRRDLQQTALAVNYTEAQFLFCWRCLRRFGGFGCNWVLWTVRTSAS